MNPELWAVTIARDIAEEEAATAYDAHARPNRSRSLPLSRVS